MIEELEDLEEDPKRSSISTLTSGTQEYQDRPIKGMNKSRSKSTHCDLL